MARVKACRLCGRRNAPDELFCEACGTSLADVPAMDERAIERLAAEGADGGAGARTADAVGRRETGGGVDDAAGQAHAVGQAEAGRDPDGARPAGSRRQPRRATGPPRIARCCSPGAACRSRAS